MNTKLSLIRRALPDNLTQKIGREMLKVEKNSPHILFGVGIVGFVGTTVLASRAILKVDEVLDKAENDLQNINEVIANKELAQKHDYTEEDALKDKFYVYSRTSVSLVKLYWPTLAVGTLSVFCLTRSHGILTQRNAALTAAYVGLDKAFSEYRKRVAEQLDPEYERDIYYDAQKFEAEVPDPEDPKKKTKVKFKTIGGRAYSQYARFFDELSPEWQKTPEYNFIFLRAQQNYANDMLRSRGHVFLNEVYDRLGIPRSQEGQVVGWVLNGEYEDFIDFGFLDGNNPRARDFINGREDAILLDFNVHGLIYDKI